MKNPAVAAILTWLVPGLGHWYQGRRAKAVLFFLCVLGTFAFGLYLGDGRVVYASWRPQDRRLPYVCQLGVGLPSLPALVQAQRFADEELQLAVAQRAQRGERLWSDWFEAPPFVFDRGLYDDGSAPQIRVRLEMQRRILNTWNSDQVHGALMDDDKSDELDLLHEHLHRYFELGTLLTMVAGLLNFLVIFDAYAGPLVAYDDRVRSQPTVGT